LLLIGEKEYYGYYSSYLQAIYVAPNELRQYREAIETRHTGYPRSAARIVKKRLVLMLLGYFEL